jgi:hypothetical protein
MGYNYMGGSLVWLLVAALTLVVVAMAGFLFV